VISISKGELPRHSVFLDRTIREASNVPDLCRSFDTVPLYWHGSIGTTFLHQTQNPLLLTDNPFAVRDLSCES
jgi:hypothetical protein